MRFGGLAEPGRGPRWIEDCLCEGALTFDRKTDDFDFFDRVLRGLLGAATTKSLPPSAGAVAQGEIRICALLKRGASDKASDRSGPERQLLSPASRR